MSDQDKPLTFKQFVDFYSKVIEPRFNEIENKLLVHDKRFDEVDQSFDDLYKKFEDLHMEYKVITHPFKEIQEGLDEELEKQLAN